MITTFNVGDEIVVETKPTDHGTLNKPTWPVDMDKLLGQVLIAMAVTQKSNDTRIRIMFGGREWFFSSTWCRLVNRAYKIGDVIIMCDTKPADTAAQGSPGWNPRMDDLLGKELIISDVDYVQLRVHTPGTDEHGNPKSWSLLMSWVRRKQSQRDPDEFLRQQREDNLAYMFS